MSGASNLDRLALCLHRLYNSNIPPRPPFQAPHVEEGVGANDTGILHGLEMQHRIEQLMEEVD